MVADPVQSMTSQLDGLSVRDPKDQESHFSYEYLRRSKAHHGHGEGDGEEDEVRVPRERLDSHDSGTSSNSTDSALTISSSDEYDEERMAELETERQLRKYSQRMVYLTRRQFEDFCARLEHKKRQASSKSRTTRRAQSGF